MGTSAEEGEQGREAAPAELLGVDLPGGRRLAIRPATEADVDGLCRLYDRLSPDDRYRRFFSSYRPSRDFVRRMVTATERGGIALVATVATPTGVEEVVAEAGCSLLDDGDGELAITVDRRWRGWLGPVLLDALLTAAAGRGIPNLEADVLVTNPPMLALARSRGAVTMSRPDWTVVRLLIGTRGRTPTRPPGGSQGRVTVGSTPAPVRDLRPCAGRRPGGRIGLEGKPVSTGGTSKEVSPPTR